MISQEEKIILEVKMFFIESVLIPGFRGHRWNYYYFIRNMLLFMLLIRKHASECDGIVTLHTDGKALQEEISFKLISRDRWKYYYFIRNMLLLMLLILFLLVLSYVILILKYTFWKGRHKTEMHGKWLLNVHWTPTGDEPMDHHPWNVGWMEYYGCMAFVCIVCLHVHVCRSICICECMAVIIMHCHHWLLLSVECYLFYQLVIILLKFYYKIIFITIHTLFHCSYCRRR